MQLVSHITGVEITKKQAKKVYNSLVKDDEINKHYVCGVTCVKSQKICMKEVEHEELYCHVHDPDRKCQGITVKGNKCGSVAKTGMAYCYRHIGNQETLPKKHGTKSKKYRTSEFVESEDDDLSDEDSSTPKDESSEDEKPKKKHRKHKKHAKKIKHDKNAADEELSADEESSIDEESPIDEESSTDEEPLFVLSSKVVDIKSKDHIPPTNKVKWAECLSNNSVIATEGRRRTRGIGRNG
jgi:hypothetical protein